MHENNDEEAEVEQESTIKLVKSGSFYNLFVDGQMMVSYDESEQELVLYSNNEKVEAPITVIDI
jgi:uncharacterized protein YqkB